MTIGNIAVSFLKFSLIFVLVIVTLGAVIIGLFAWSNANAASAHAMCEMRILEQSFVENRAFEYRRQCMRSKGYVISTSCWSKNYTVASCFHPRWIFWIDTIDV